MTLALVAVVIAAVAPGFRRGLTRFRPEMPHEADEDDSADFSNGLNAGGNVGPSYSGWGSGPARPAGAYARAKRTLSTNPDYGERTRKWDPESKSGSPSRPLGGLELSLQKIRNRQVIEDWTAWCAWSPVGRHTVNPCSDFTGSRDEATNAIRTRHLTPFRLDKLLDLLQRRPIASLDTLIFTAAPRERRAIRNRGAVKLRRGQFRPWSVAKGTR